MQEKKTICIDPGHGGTDPGAVNGAFTEKYVALEIGKALKKELLERGYIVYMTRSEDVFHTPYQKAKYANQVNADIFVSIHCNSAASESAHGTETLSFDLDGKSFFLAQAIQKSLIAATTLTNRGVKQRRDLIVLNTTSMPAALVETAFISNPEEKRLLMTDAFRKKTAKAIAEGIDSYFGLKKGNDASQEGPFISTAPSETKEDASKTVAQDSSVITVAQAKKIIQTKTGFDENTMHYLEYYRYADSLLIRLAKAMDF